MGTRLYQGNDMGQGAWEPLVTEETWHAVRAMLENPARRSNTESTARKWLGSGLYLCGRCPADDRSDMRVNYREEGVRVYRCRRHMHLSRSADPVDEYVSEVIVARLRRPDLADLLLDESNANAGVRTLADVRREAAGLRKRIDGLGVELADGVLTPRQVQVATQRLTLKLRACEDEMAKAGQTSALHRVAAAPDPGAAWLAADLQEQRAVLDVLATVTLLPGPGARDAREAAGGRWRGWAGARARFEPESVQIEPRTTG
jgi:hypothetical protein